MTNVAIRLDNGEEDYNPDIPSEHGALPEAFSLESPTTEGLGELTHRAYGANTQANRAKITKANVSLDGLIRIPR
jgi:hypothetical protein